MSDGSIVTLLRELDHYEDHLVAAGRDGKAHSVRQARRSIHEASTIPPDPSVLDGIGEYLRDVIVEFRASGEIAELSELRERRPYLDELTEVDGVGPKRAVRLYEQAGVETVDDLMRVDLTTVDGIGPAREDTITDSAWEILEER